MKNFLKIFILLSSQLFWSQNTIGISSDPVSLNAAFSVGVEFTNSAAISAFQFDLQYNKNTMQLETGHALTGRVGDHTISTSEISDNTIRVIVFSPSNQAIAAGSGAVVTLNFTSKNEPGTYNMIFSNVVVSDPNTDAVSMSINDGQVTVLGTKFNLITGSIDFLDVPLRSTASRQIEILNEGNQTLEISSHSLVAPLSILEEFPINIPAGGRHFLTLNLDTSSAQVVEDQTLFVTNDTDASRALQELVVNANIYSVNEIQVGNGSGVLGDNIVVPVSINNMDSFNGFQLDIAIPSGVEYVENSITLSGRHTDHTVSASVINSDVLRVISYSPNNANFTGASGQVFVFSLAPISVSGIRELPVSNSIISNENLGNTVSDSYGGSIRINAPSLNFSTSILNLGRVPLSIPIERTISLTNRGDAMLIISDVLSDVTALSSSIVAPLNISSNQSINQTVTFTPDALGEFSGSIAVFHNGTAIENTIQVTAEVYDPNYLYIEEQYVLRENDYTVNLGISNTNDIRALQFDINIPDGFIFDYSNIQTLSILENFIVSSTDRGNGDYRFVIYNIGENSVSAGSSVLLELPISVETSIPLGDYNFDITNIVLSNSSNTDVATEQLAIGTIHVVENIAPVITPDTKTVLEDALLTSIDVVANDFYLGENELALSIIGTDVNGTIAVNSDGVSIDYTPPANFNGTEEITYALSDGEYTDQGTLTITVISVNDTPVALDDSFVLDDGSTKVVSLLASDIDGNKLSYSIVSQPSHGSVIINGDKATYTANTNYSGSDSFTFVASDGVLNSNEATLSINVTLDVVTFELSSIKSYPNPFDSFYFIDNPVPVKLEIYDINGRMLLLEEFEIGKNKIDASFLSPGFYLFKLTHQNMSSSQIRIKR